MDASRLTSVAFVAKRGGSSSVPSTRSPQATRESRAGVSHITVMVVPVPNCRWPAEHDLEGLGIGVPGRQGQGAVARFWIPPPRRTVVGFLDRGDPATESVVLVLVGSAEDDRGRGRVEHVARRIVEASSALST